MDAAAEPIKTYIFIDIETTGLPEEEFKRTKITEISLVGCSREQINETAAGEVPRVQHKLTLCLNPQKLISPKSTEISALDNYMLEHESPFNENTVQCLNAFLKHFSEPVCLVAHNGDKFDFPIIQKELQKFNFTFSPSVRCVDSLLLFREIDEQEQQISTSDHNNTFQEKNLDQTRNSDLIDELFKCEKINWQKINETTPHRSKSKANIHKHHSLSRTLKPKELFPMAAGSLKMVKKKFTLIDIYERKFGQKPNKSHFAEDDTISLMKCVIATKKPFLEMADQRSKLFSSVKAINK